ncbi:MAG: NAD-dependent epimerase/dehydratase family protein [Mucilaginibacter sp.]|uniref:NAD-dependent epimerase/dehydratase family protein n=1 Tax=Mucilaginibacter sp. TaxID=1882438 RepID=UPI0031A92D1D
MNNFNLITGRFGFLGKGIYDYFIQSNMPLISLGRNENDDLKYDLVFDEIKLNQSFNTVIHCAGKAHVVPRSEKEKQDFFEVNVTGTNNLLKALEKTPPKAFVFISSVSVYGLETGTLINEESHLLAKDPYGLSKIQAELIVTDWCSRHGVICTILRLPLLAAANPPGNLGAMISGIKKGHYVNIAGGTAKKSIVLVEDVASIIPTVAAIGGTFNLTDGYHPSFFELSVLIAEKMHKSAPYNISYFIAWPIALIGDLVGKKSPINRNKLIKITSDLTFDDSKAKRILGWKPNEVLKKFNL